MLTFFWNWFFDFLGNVTATKCQFICIDHFHSLFKRISRLFHFIYYHSNAINVVLKFKSAHIHSKKIRYLHIYTNKSITMSNWIQFNWIPFSSAVSMAIFSHECLRVFQHRVNDKTRRQKFISPIDSKFHFEYIWALL